MVYERLINFYKKDRSLSVLLPTATRSSSLHKVTFNCRVGPDKRLLDPLINLAHACFSISSNIKQFVPGTFNLWQYLKVEAGLLARSMLLSMVPKSEPF